MSLQQLKVYDGVAPEGGGRICVAVNGKIFDVTKGKRFYGPGGTASAVRRAQSSNRRRTGQYYYDTSRTGSKTTRFLL